MMKRSSWPVSAEQLLQQTEVLTSSGSWCLNLATNQLLWSEQTYQLFERPLDNPINLDDALGYYPAPFRAQVLQAIDEALTGKESWQFESKIITAKGQVKWVKKAICILGLELPFLNSILISNT